MAADLSPAAGTAAAGGPGPAQDALHESEAQFRAITNSIDQMIWSTQPDGFHDFYNDRWYEFTGVPRGSTDGAEWNGMFHPQDQQRAWAVWRHSLETGEPYHIEYRLRHRDGSYRWVLGRAQPVRDASGAIVRWFGTCTDIQEIVEAREIIQRSRESLEQQVRERTQQLLEAESRLLHAQKMEAIGQLTGGIAHDFNNMLQGISGAVDLCVRLLRAGRHAEVPKYLEMAMASVQRAASMTQRLLAFSRRHPLAAQVVDVNALLLSLQELLNHTVGENIRLHFELQADPCHVVCDPHQLESAVLNLAINSRDAMPQGGTLAVQTRITAAPALTGEGEALAGGDYVRISVRDTGTGMDEATLRQAFEPFFTTKATGQGTGLGLPMVYGFARQSQGLAQLESRPGEGTSVHLLLPRTGRGPQAAAPAAPPQEDAQTAGRILLVEDDEMVRRLLLRSLCDVGYRVTEAGTGDEALALLARSPGIELLLTDVGLPGGMNGRQLAEQALQQRPGLGVLLMTGYMEDTSVEAHLPMLMKPVRLDVLLRRVEELLAAARQSG